MLPMRSKPSVMLYVDDDVLAYCSFLVVTLMFQVLERRSELQQHSADRRSMLEDSRRLQQLNRDADEAKAWINEKLKTASDESYKVMNLLLNC